MKRYCKNCQKISEAEQELKFCSHCGTPFEPIGEPEDKPVSNMPPVIPMAQAQSAGGTAREEKYCAWEDKAHLGFFGALYETWRESLFNTTRFFRRMPTTAGIGNPLFYAIILGMVGVVFSIMYQQFWGNLLNMADWYEEFGYAMDPDLYDLSQFSSQMQSASMLFKLVLSPVFIIITLFITAGIAHLVLLIFGWSKTGFEGTFRVFGYSYSAVFFEIIPLFGGLVTLVWSIIMYVIGLREIHRISTGKAILVVIVPITLVCLCCCGLVISIMSMAGFSNF